MKKVLLLLVGIGMIFTSCSTSGNVNAKVVLDFKVRKYKAITAGNVNIIVTAREPLYNTYVYTVGDTVNINPNNLIGLEGIKVVIKDYL